MENKRGHMGKTVIFESKDDHDLFLKDYNSPSLTKKIFSNWMYQGKYNTLSIKFKENIINELLKKDFITENKFSNYNFELEKLHLCLKSELKNLDESEQNEISISFYETSHIIKKSYVTNNKLIEFNSYYWNEFIYKVKNNFNINTFPLYNKNFKIIYEYIKLKKY